ncbi:MAG: hypothetical protein H0X15_08180, partial [Acidobacteria bacterium]|nr:hypothetical protein [Acidobacteriota bacterium]
KNQRLNIEKLIKEIEKELPQLEAKLADLTVQMSATETVSSHGKLQEVSAAYEKTNKQIQSLYAEWESLESTL